MSEAAFSNYGVSMFHTLVLTMTNLLTKSEVSSCSCSRDTKEDPKCKLID